MYKGSGGVNYNNFVEVKLLESNIPLMMIKEKYLPLFFTREF